MRLSVIAPCYNEEGNVPTLVERTLSAFDGMEGVEAELVLIDDGSADDTWGAIERASAEHDRVRGVRHVHNLGIVGGWRTGLAAARGELVCLIDSDLQNRPEDVARLYDAYVEHEPDIVQGVRNPRGVQTRLVFSRGLNLLLNTAFGMRLRDNKSGFILCPRDVLASILDYKYEYRFFQSFVGVAAGARNYSIVEVDTDFERRHTGESFLANFPITVSLRICVELVKYRYETLAHKPKTRR